MPPSGEPSSGLDPQKRGRLAARVGAPHLFPVALTLTVALGGYFLLRPGGWASEQLHRAVTSPQTQVKEALARMTQAQLADVYGFSSGGTASLEPVIYGDVTVQMDQGRADVLAVVDASGVVDFKGEHATLAYVGREAFSMRPCPAAGWCADGAEFRRLRAALALLFRRLDAMRDGDIEGLERLVSEHYEGGKPGLSGRLARDLKPANLSPKAWQIRVERDTAEVGEDDVVSLPSKPPAAERSRLRLAWEDGHFRIVAGL